MNLALYRVILLFLTLIPALGVAATIYHTLGIIFLFLVGLLALMEAR